MTDRQQDLLNAIESAFQGVELGNGISLHETVVKDLYGTLDERQAARGPDEKIDWHNLIDDPELLRICGVGGLSFYDAEGLRFHLPAYLTLVVKGPRRGKWYDVLESLVFQLTEPSEWNHSRLSILNKPQREVIRDVLIYIRETDADYTNDAALVQAIRTYWDTCTK